MIDDRAGGGSDPPGSGPLFVAPTSDLAEFADLFNRELFWESHEVLEGPWREGRSSFYHGLILLASAFVHLQRGNPHGPGAQLLKARRALEPCRPTYLGVDVDALLAEADGTIRGGSPGAPDPGAEGSGPAYPRLRFDPGLVRGDEPELRRSSG